MPMPPPNPIMPRYQLHEADADAIFAYSKSLRSAAPGVDRDKIRFAVVIDESVDPERRDAVPAVARAPSQPKFTGSAPG